MPSIDLKAYARRGAEARVAELTAELKDIYKAFPDLETWHRSFGYSDDWCWWETPKTEANVSRAEGGSVEADEGVLGGEATFEIIGGSVA